MAHRCTIQHHSGGATTSLVASLVILGGLVATAVVFSPQFAGASSSEASLGIEPALNERQVVDQQHSLAPG